MPGDWRRLIALQPDGAFVAEWDAQPVGTVIVTLFDDVAWVSMMLVVGSFRGRGIGRKLMDRALEFAEDRGARSIRLDATPLGRPLYESLGFAADFALVRYAGTVGHNRLPKSSETSEVSVADVAPLDRDVTRTNRRQLLKLLARERPLWGVVRDGDVRGYITSRPGSRAAQIGPCIADAASGPTLLAHAFGEWAGQPVFVDVPREHHAAIETTAAHGLSPTRELLRMTRSAPVAERRESLWASAGPEKG